MGPLTRLLFLSLFLCAACGPGAPTPAETAPFRTAVEAYLAAQSMEMRSDSFATLAVTGDTATAEVQLAPKGDSYGVRPRWQFRFAKKASAWQVTSVRR